MRKLRTGLILGSLGFSLGAVRAIARQLPPLPATLPSPPLRCPRERWAPPITARWPHPVAPLLTPTARAACRAVSDQQLDRHHHRNTRAKLHGTASATIKVTDSSQPSRSPPPPSEHQDQPSHPRSSSMTTTSLPGGIAASPYPSTTLQASGGVRPYTWALASGSTLPAGLSLSTAGVLSGTPALRPAVLR